MFKKILSALLAAVMVAGTSVTAFAEPIIPQEAIDELKDFAEEINGEPLFGWALYGDLAQSGAVLDEDNQIVGFDINDIAPGHKLAFDLYYAGEVDADADVEQFLSTYDEFSLIFGYAIGGIEFIKNLYFWDRIKPEELGGNFQGLNSSKQVKGYKAEILFDKAESEELVEKVSIEPFYLEGELFYVLMIEFVDDVESIDPEDLVGKAVIYKRSKSNYIEYYQEVMINDDKFATVGYDSIDYDESGFENITGEGNGAPVRDFDAANMNETAELYFEGVGYFFSGDVSTEAPKYLAFNYTPDYELLAKYPTADMEFINFPGMVKFNQFGSFELFKEPDQFAYAVVDGELVTLESIARLGKVVDGEDEGYSVVLQLKNFPESFVLSDTELEIAEAVEEVEEAVDAQPAA